MSDAGRPRLALVGARGRMGRTLVELAPGAGFEVVAELDQGDDLTPGLDRAQVAIDFSVREITGSVAKHCAHLGRPLVIGTTGHESSDLETIREAARAVPVVFAPNYSIGVNTLFWLTRRAAEILGPDFAIEIVEMHHDQKRDAPSGTAKRLAEIACDARGLDYGRDVRHGREGLVGARTGTEIGMHALRGGDVVGDHTVMFAIQGERVELTHKASSRATFAQGALRAAHWALDQKKPGLFDMQDVLGLR